MLGEPPKQSVKAILAKEGTFYSKYLQGSDFIELQVLNFHKQRETRMEFSKIFYGVIDLLGFEKESVMILEHGFYDQFLEIEA